MSNEEDKNGIELQEEDDKDKKKVESNKQDKIEVEWTIVKTLPGLVFDVQLPDEFWWWIVKWYLGWRMKKHFIKLIEWDKVSIELSPYDTTKWRIVFRKK